MSALMPRLLGDLTGWFDTDFPVRTGHMIRVGTLTVTGGVLTLPTNWLATSATS